MVRVGSKESMPFPLVLALYYTYNKGVRPDISTWANIVVGWLVNGKGWLGSDPRSLCHSLYSCVISLDKGVRANMLVGWLVNGED